MEHKETFLGLNKDIIESGILFNDKYMQALLVKIKNLTFSFDLIKETLLNYFEQNNVDLSSVLSINKQEDELSKYLDERKFIEKLVQASLNKHNNSHNSILPGVSDLSLNFDNKPQAAKTPIGSTVTSPTSSSIPTSAKSKQEYNHELMKRYNDPSNLRPIIVDCDNVALYTSPSNPNEQKFSMTRVKIVVEFFEKRRHQIFVIMSSHRKDSIRDATQYGANSVIFNPHTDLSILLDLEVRNLIFYTPSKTIGMKNIVCDDSKYMIQLAILKNGIILSNNDFKNFLTVSEEFRLVIEERVLMYSFIGDTLILVDDPLGETGPSLEHFLRFETFSDHKYMKKCPYLKKCTYGAKCKYWHPERFQ